MSRKRTPVVPPHGRLVSAALAAVGAIGLVINHFAAGSQGFLSLTILGLGPLVVCLGIGGLIEPRIMWSLGKYGKDLPAVYKILGGALASAGVAVTVLLLVFVYRLGPPR